MKNEEINSIEDELIYTKKNYTDSVIEVIKSIILFAGWGSLIALLSFSPLALAIKIPALLINFGMFAYSDCRRIDKWNAFKTMCRLKQESKNEEENLEIPEEKDEEDNNDKEYKMTFGEKIKKLFHKKNKTEQLPLPSEEVTDDLDTIEEDDNDKEYKMTFGEKIKKLFHKKNKTEQLPLPSEEVTDDLDTVEEDDNDKEYKITFGEKIKKLFHKKNKTEQLPLPSEEVIENNSTISNLNIKDTDRINKVNKLSSDPRKATIIKMPNLSESVEGKVKYMVNAEDFITQNIIASYLYGQTGEIVKPRTKTVDGEKVKVYTIGK